MKRFNDRRGQGLVMPFVLGLLMVLGIGAMLILYNTGTNLRQASKDAGGLIVESLALSAIEEGIHRFQVAVNDPRHPLFREVRKALIEGNQVSVDLATCCDPEKLRLELHEFQEMQRGFRLGGCVKGTGRSLVYSHCPILHLFCLPVHSQMG